MRSVARRAYLTLRKTADADRELAWSKGKQLEYRFMMTQARALQEQGKLRASEELTQKARQAKPRKHAC
jgi:hypothetical protein